MELKQFQKGMYDNGNRVLIVPYGIETHDMILLPGNACSVNCTLWN